MNGPSNEKAGQSEQNQPTKYDCINETYKLLATGILRNSLISKSLPANASSYALQIQFTGHQKPTVAIPWRFAESVASLKALEAIMVGSLLTEKYAIPPQRVEINLDHAQLFVMSGWLTSLVINGDSIRATKPDPRILAVFPSCDIYRALGSPYRISIVNTYRTKDSRYFQMHGSLNPSIMLQALGMPEDGHGDFEESVALYQKIVSKLTAAEMEDIVSEKTNQAGTTCLSVDEYKESEHGQANAHVGLWETHFHINPTQKPAWWLPSNNTSPARPLAGLKVVDLTRIIAGPAVTRGLAELGASIMRITAPHIPDLGFLHPDLGWGKWNCSLDFRDPAQLAAAKALIAEADVVVSGYRPAVLDKYGLGETGILQLTRNRTRGIIFVRENCYGWYGPWADRSGWQQISDACCGISYEFGRAMGNNESVTPVFPNSDYCTGIIGVCGILDALMQRSRNGGSYTVDISLNYYNQWLANSVGTYPEDVWQEVWKRNGKQVMRHHTPMAIMTPWYIDMLANHSPYLFDEQYFEDREATVAGVHIRTVKPVLQWTDGVIQPGFQVGARENGADKPEWPDDLMSELVV